MLISGTTDVRYLKSDTTDNRYRCPILQILYLLCLQCKAPFTLHTVPYFDARMWTHDDVRRVELDLCGMLHPSSYGDAVCVNAAAENSVLHYKHNVTIHSVNRV